MRKMKTLPKTHIEFCNMLYDCIDFEYLKECSCTLAECIKSEKNTNKLTIEVVQDWLQGLPTACTIPFQNYRINQILESCGKRYFSIEDYWRFSASRILAFAVSPKCYE